MDAFQLVEIGRQKKGFDGLLDKLSEIVKVGKKHDCLPSTVEFALRKVAGEQPNATLKKVNLAVAAFVRRYEDEYTKKHKIAGNI
ncbi:MAG: hypothetical protein IK117_04600 [Bacteroidales bacterium]|nr:hypothetical protein [Bacteroidales bacterium]